MPASKFASSLAATAVDQLNKYKDLHETDPGLAKQINAYWTDLGLVFPGVQTAWSAVFISWCVKKAGASSAEFAFSAQHSVFVHAAIANATAGQGVFRGRKITDYAPKVGDIIQNNRPINPPPPGHPFSFDYAATHSDYSSHSAIVVEAGSDHIGPYVATIGGNEGNSVAYRVIRLSAAGLIKQPAADPNHFICVIEDLK
jgi:hypothetical protein